MEPPEIVKYRRPKARLTNRNRKNINEYGLKIPSKNSRNYEPNVNDHALLWESTGYNFKVKAKANRNASQKSYMEQRAKLAALPPVTPKKNNNTKKKNNGTKRTLF